MNYSGKCVICGEEGGCGALVMGQYVCIDCQTLLDDPRRRVFGCPHNRRIVKSTRQKRLELARTRN